MEILSSDVILKKNQQTESSSRLEWYSLFNGHSH